MWQYLSRADPTLNSYNTPGLASFAGNGQVFTGRATRARTFSDGAANTICFAEHYAFNCSKTQFFWFHELGPQTFPQANGITIHRASFADEGDLVPMASSNSSTTVASVPGLTFQVRPPISDCNPGIAQTPHRSGMLVALGDGSVRTLSPTMAEQTYWAALTPAGAETVAGDW
jgi:hypothetical protein